MHQRPTQEPLDDLDDWPASEVALVHRLPFRRRVLQQTNVTVIPNHPSPSALFRGCVPPGSVPSRWSCHVSRETHRVHHSGAVPNPHRADRHARVDTDGASCFQWCCLQATSLCLVATQDMPYPTGLLPFAVCVAGRAPRPPQMRSLIGFEWRVNDVTSSPPSCGCSSVSAACTASGGKGGIASPSSSIAAGPSTAWTEPSSGFSWRY